MEARWYHDESSSREHRLEALVSGIDGVLLHESGPLEGLSPLLSEVEARRDAPRLVYATRQSIVAVRELIRADLLPEPDAIVSSFGTEVWMPPWRHADTGFAARLAPGWDRAAVAEALQVFPELVKRPGRFQSPFKASYYVEDDCVDRALRVALRRRGLACRVICSEGGYLDVVPAGAGRRVAVEYVMSHWGISGSICLAAGGGSRNELALTADPRLAGVLAGADAFRV